MIKTCSDANPSLGIRPFVVVLKSERMAIDLLPDALPFHIQEVDGWENAFRKLSSFRPGCILLDFDHQRDLLLEQIRELADQGIRFTMVGVTADRSRRTLHHAMRNGFIDLVSRPINERVLVETMEEAFRADADGHDSLCEIRSCFGKLTPTERKMLPHLLRGIPSKRLSTQFDVTYQTIDRHRKHVIQKMQVDNMTELAMKLYRKF